MTRSSIWVGTRCRQCVLVAAVNTGTGCRACGAHVVRCAHGRRVGAPYRCAAAAVDAAGGRCSGPRWCRCRSPRTGCGSWISCRGPSPVYNMPTALRISGALDVEALGAAPGGCGGSPRESAHAVRGGRRGYRSRWSLPVERADFGWARRRCQRLAGGAAGARPSARRRGHSFDLAARDSVAGKAFPASPMTSMCWWRWCTISPPTAGRSRRWCVIWAWPMPAGVRGQAPRLGAVGGAVCGLHAVAAASSWVTRTTPTADRRAAGLLGAGAGRAARAAAAAHRSARTRRSPISAAPA